MLKRSLLAVGFIVAFSVAGVAVNKSASAHGCGYGYSYYPGYSAYYGYPAPVVVRRSPVYPVYYGDFDGHRHRRHRHHHHHHDHHRHSGVSISFGF